MNLTDIKGYDNEKSLARSQRDLFRTIGFADLKKECIGEKEFKISFRKALVGYVFTPYVLKEYKKAKQDEYELDRISLSFKAEYELDNYILQLFTGWRIADFLREPKRMEKTLNDVAEFRNREPLNDDLDFSDVKMYLMYDTLYKYMNRKQDSYEIHIEDNVLNNDINIYLDEKNVLKNKYFDATKCNILTISKTENDNEILISADIELIKDIYSFETGLKGAMLTCKRRLENFIKIKNEDFSIFCQNLLINKRTLTSFINYNFEAADNITEFTQSEHSDYRKLIKDFIYSSTDYIICGNEVISRRRLKNMLKSQIKDYDINEITFAALLLRKFPVDMSNAKNENLVKEIFDEIMAEKQKA